MLILGIETSCDETGLALYDAGAGGLLAHAVHSQVAMHEAYGGVVPELASRDHIRRLVPLSREVLARAGRTHRATSAPSPTPKGPGLAGALLAGAAFARSLAHALGVPAIGIHHLEGHLLSPLLSARAPRFPFVALLVSGGHTQLMRVQDVGRYELLGETQDDAAGEAFDKTAQAARPGLSRRAGALPARRIGQAGTLPAAAADDRERRPRVQFFGPEDRGADAAEKGNRESPTPISRALSSTRSSTCWSRSARWRWNRPASRNWWSPAASAPTSSCAPRWMPSGRAAGFDVFYPEPELCTDNGAMIAFAAALRLQAGKPSAAADHAFSVRPRWDLATLSLSSASRCAPARRVGFQVRGGDLQHRRRERVLARAREHRAEDVVALGLAARLRRRAASTR